MRPTYPLPPFHLHPEVLGTVVLLAGGYWWMERRLRPRIAPTAAPASPGRWTAWMSGVAVLWVSASWPVHDLAEETLFALHMLEHMLIGYVVPPLLLVGLPRWAADLALRDRRVGRVVSTLGHPVAAFFAFNGALVAIHWPQAIAWQQASELAHLAAHTLMALTGFMFWLRVFPPTPRLPRLSRPMAMLYLFLATIIPTVPASFLTFSDTVLYPGYGDAPLAWGLSPVEDQMIGGLIMKLGGGFYLLGIIVRLWVQWIREERTWDGIERELAESSPPPRSDR